MKKQTSIIVLIISFLIVLLAGAGSIIILHNSDISLMDLWKKAERKEENIRMFKEWTDVDVFQNIPAMVVEGTKIDEAEDYGSDVFLIRVHGTELNHYSDYLEVLESAGYKKYVDNGDAGLDNTVYTATYTKDNTVVTVAQITSLNMTYITASEDMPLSKHLFYDDSYMHEASMEAKTTLAMLELYDYGSGFVFQLKNGHFVIFDGGLQEDGENLLNYLEANAPGDAKPVVDAWFFSHGHGDHAQVVEYFSNNTELAKRFYVEGIYFNKANQTVASAFGSGTLNVEKVIDFMPYLFTASDGTRPEVYRTQIGQRYYFNDIIMDVIFTQEQIPLENYQEGYNASSTWLMVEVEGQKILFGADGGRGSMQRVMKIYSQQYMDVDIFQALHHSNDTWNVFTDYCKCKTVLVPRRGMQTIAANDYLVASCDEYYAWGDGTVKLTFPYEVGTAEILSEIWPEN